MHFAPLPPNDSRMLEMVKVRKGYVLLAFIDISKASDTVNREHLFEVMRVRSAGKLGGRDGEDI